MKGNLFTRIFGSGEKKAAEAHVETCKSETSVENPIADKIKRNAEYLFVEQWETAREAVIKEVVDSYGPIPWPAHGALEGGGVFAVMREEQARRRKAEESDRVKQWERENPLPSQTRDEYIAALAKKGGAR